MKKKIKLSKVVTYRRKLYLKYIKSKEALVVVFTDVF